MASLTIVVEGVEQKVPLESASVTLGRGLESDVRLKDIKASRRHCQVVKTPKGYQCVDLSSGNGTYVNGVQIKSQMLNPGDKITIGSTTILFEDAPKVAASPKAATAKIPVAAAAPPPARPAPGKGATARVQVAPTKRTTERVEAARSGSQVGLKPASQALPKSSSHAIPKSGSRLSKAVPRPPSVRPPRPAVEAPARKKGPAILIAILVFVALIGGGAYYFFVVRDTGDQVKEQILQLQKKGDDARDQERFEEALQEYRAALALCQGDRHKVRASDLSKRIAQIEGKKGVAAPAKVDPKEAPDRDGEFQARKAEIAERRKLADASAADWARAVKDWTEFASRKSAPDASRAQAEIRLLQGKAREEALRLKEKADTLVRENKAAEALDLLKHQVDRFEGIDARADLDAAIKQLDK
jgi:hypothetical protein